MKKTILILIWKLSFLGTNRIVPNIQETCAYTHTFTLKLLIQLILILSFKHTLYAVMYAHIYNKSHGRIINKNDNTKMCHTERDKC